MSELQTGDMARLQSAGDTLRVCKRLAEGGQGAVYLAEMNGRQFALNWYREFRNPAVTEQFAASIAKLIERGKPQHDAFIWPIDMVVCEGRGGFGYLMPLMDTRFRSFGISACSSHAPSP